MSRTLLPGVIAMAIIVVASNILVQFLYGDWLTYGAFTYPFAFLVTDITNRLYGAAAARRVVLVGFAVGLICSLIGTLFSNEFGPLVTLRIAAGSGLAFLVAQLTDVFVFNRLRAGNWWRAPFVSTLISSSLDTVIFFTVAFSAWLVFVEPSNDVSFFNQVVPVIGIGPEAPRWMSLALADFSVKLAIAVFALIPFRLIVGHIISRAPQKTV